MSSVAPVHHQRVDRGFGSRDAQRLTGSLPHLSDYLPSVLPLSAKKPTGRHSSTPSMWRGVSTRLFRLHVLSRPLTNIVYPRPVFTRPRTGTPCQAGLRTDTHRPGLTSPHHSNPFSEALIHPSAAGPVFRSSSRALDSPNRPVVRVGPIIQRQGTDKTTHRPNLAEVQSFTSSLFVPGHGRFELSF